MTTWPLPHWKTSRLTWCLLAAASCLELFWRSGVMEPALEVGFVSLSWAVFPVVGLLAFARRPHLRHPAPAATLLLAVLVLSAASYAATAGWATAVAVLLAVLSEEVIYRLALPVLLSTALIRTGRGTTVAIAWALGLSGLLFVLMPGHLSQMNGAGSVLEFVAFAFLMSYVVWRKKSLLLAVGAHAAIDFLTFGVGVGFLSPSARSVGAAVTLLAVTGALLKSRGMGRPLARRSHQAREMNLFDAKTPVA